MKVNKTTKAGSAKSTTVIEGVHKRIPLDLIVNNPNLPNPREIDKDWAEELSKDIESNGLDTPIIVWNGGSDNIKMKIGGESHPASFIIAGGHRREALRILRKRNPKRFDELFKAGVPVVVRGGELQDALCLQLRENVQRKEMAADEIFPVLQRLRDEFKLKQVEIAKRVGKSEAWVSQMFAIEKTLGPEAVEEIKKGGLSVTDAQKAADKVKKAAKEGKEVAPVEEVKKAKENTKALKEAGRQRSEKRKSAKALFKVYKSLPAMRLGEKVTILEAALTYLAGESETLPEELETADAESKSEA